MTRTATPTWPRRRRALFASTLALAMTFGTFAPFAIGALGPFIVTDLEISRSQLGVFTTVLFAVGAACSVFVGPLVDRLGGRRLLVVTFVAAALTLLAMALSGGYGWLLAAGAIGGFAIAGTNPVTNQLVGVHIPRGTQGVIMGVKQSGVQLGAFLAGGLLPPAAVAFGWRGALLLAAAVPAAGLPLTWTAVPPDPPAPATVAGRTPSLPPDERPFVLWLAVYAALMGAGVSAVGVYLPLYGVEALAFSPTVAGLLAALVGLVGIASRIVWGHVSERRAIVTGPLIAVAGGSVVGILLLWAAGAVGGWLAWLGAGLLGATAVAWNAVGMLAIVRQVAATATGAASGVVLVGFYLGYIFAPVTFGWSIDVTGAYTAGWAGLAALFLVAAVVAGRRPTPRHR